MRIIGLTGSIACGKSNVSDTLKQLGAAVIDGDVLSRELTAPGGAALPAIRAAFGAGVFLPDGTLDRKALGAAVFGHADALAVLDGIMQPLLYDMIRSRIDLARRAKAPLCVLDMPLLYEKDLDSLCDRVWAVWLPREEQLRRLMARDSLTADEAEARIRSQLSADAKAARADVVIDTSGSISSTKAMIPDLYRTELAADAL